MNPISSTRRHPIIPREKLDIKEIEELGYYDFMGYLEVPFFNIGGASSMDKLIEMCGINGDSEVLEVGCGTGGNACYVARATGCHVTGIDIAEHMVAEAKNRAEKEGLADRVTFSVGDAYNLKYPDEVFDSVVTVFVSQFLDLERAFPEFLRVLKPGGRLGINEMSKMDAIPAEAVERVKYGEQVFRDLTGLPFNIRSNEEWMTQMRAAGYEEAACTMSTGVSYNLNTISEFGGWLKLLGTLAELAVLAARSSKLRKRMATISKGKGVLLRDKIASKYIGYILCVGAKPTPKEN